MSQAVDEEATEDPTAVEWDVIVVGTGIGGGTVGYELSRMGRRVLFVEKGRFLQREADTRQGDLGEPSEEPVERLRRGWWPFSVTGTTGLGGRWRKRRWTRISGNLSVGEVDFFAPLGCGTGGSSVLYGATLERFHPSDFRPREFFPEASQSTLPEAWPITPEELDPFYARAEALYDVHGTPDPLHPTGEADLPLPPALNDRDQDVFDFMQGRGLHPYRIHIGARFVEGCDGCGGRLCIRACKSDSARVCVLPAIEKHGARLLSECVAEELLADQNRVQGVRCRWRGQTITLRGRIVVAAAGALSTPVLLLNSKNDHWPSGLANRSGLVGRNLMVHTGDMIAIRPPKGGAADGFNKSISVNDFYLHEGRKLGNFQSVGVQIDTGSVFAHLRTTVDKSPGWVQRLAHPILLRIGARIGAWWFRSAVVFGSIVEDLPYAENRVEPDSNSPSGMRFAYEYPEELAERNALFREGLARTLGRSRVVVLTRPINLNFGHSCGTCRFGENPETSVLDAKNRAHDVDNLYVPDASFFPSSSGTNPSLTIAANALRVADAIEEHLVEGAPVRCVPGPSGIEQMPSIVGRNQREANMLFEGKTIIVTGAGSGIGRSLAIGFARDGAEVVGFGRTRESLETTAAECGGRMRFVVGDVARESDVEALFAEATRGDRGVDVLVNNAAVYPRDEFLSGDHQDWVAAFETNVFGMALCCRKALPGMLERGHGRILNMGSFAWKGPIARASAYSASKAAVSILTASLVTEIDRARYPDVLVNELLAGQFKTGMSDVGEHADEAYPHARALASLPAGGPTGEIFLGSEIYREEGGGLRSRVRRLLARLTGG
jgi:choline dehydrogenase-like flavoprotein/NAD(P)-dependent dehydrogenase (short-subunit alcohol dehydrogenase family)